MIGFFPDRVKAAISHLADEEGAAFEAEVILDHIGSELRRRAGVAEAERKDARIHGSHHEAARLSARREALREAAELVNAYGSAVLDATSDD